ncbi:MAG: PorT family protein [Prevotellaceae bacterium]|jgi:hypothetical protein|nr:PorT family protein [Prevotellaceae bacterium]
MQIKNILVITILIFFIGTAQVKAQEENNSENYRLSMGVAVGTDIGGAVPFPFSHIPTPFNPYPQLKVGFGGIFTLPITKRWAIGADITYKSVGMKADARVENQKFNMDGTDVYFTGSAKMDMSFTFLEVPLYAKYSFKKGYDRIIAGFYYSYTFTSSFQTTPKKGFIGYEPNKVEIEDVSDVIMDFDEILDNWDVGFLVGYERGIFERLNLGLRFSMGFKDILIPSSNYFDYKMIPIRGSISINYNLIKTKPLFGKK